MYAHPDYKQGYEDALDGRPMKAGASSTYKTGWQARAGDVPDDSE